MTHWLRHGRTVDVLEKEVTYLIKQSFVVKVGQPEDDFMDRGRLFVNALFGGGEGDDVLLKWDKVAGNFVPSEFKKEVVRFCEVASFRTDGPQWVHFCNVRPGSADELSGRRVGER